MSTAVICTYVNPLQGHFPRRNLLRFLRWMGILEIPVFVAELAHETESFFLPSEPNFFRFHTTSADLMWQKERLINLAATRVPVQYDKLAWIDPDVSFTSDSWYRKTDAALDHRAVVQLFSGASWTNSDGLCNRRMEGTMSAKSLDSGRNHPASAWAARRSLWHATSGLFEGPLAGAGDALFANACLGAPPISGQSLKYKNWHDSFVVWAKANGGCDFIQGEIIHEWVPREESSLSN